MTDEQLDRMVRDADPYRPVDGHLAGAEQTLLEEILSEAQPARVRRLLRTPDFRRTAVALTAAAALTGVLAFSALAGRGDAPGSQAAPPSAPGPPRPLGMTAVLGGGGKNPRRLVDEPGGTATSVYGFTEREGTIAWVNGARQLEINWYRADYYQSYYDDRLDVSAPEPTTVDGQKGDRFTYSASDFAVMLKPRDGSFAELRTGGPWDRASFDAVLEHVKRVDVEAWLDALPEAIVTPDRAAKAAAEMFADWPKPPGFDPASLEVLGVNDRYQFTAQASKVVGCGWIAELERARKAGDGAAEQRAEEVLRGSRDWKALQALVDEGDWAESFWEVVERYADDDVADGWGKESLDCEE